jgi:predicted nucleic acid-binding protein
MYAAGTDHPNKEPSVTFLEKASRGAIDAVVDAEVLQEILHRYRAIRRWSDGQQVYDLSRRIFPIVIPITAEILDRARGLLDGYDQLKARDALHAAVVLTQDLDAICSYDQDFDQIEAVERIEPQ